MNADGASSAGPMLLAVDPTLQVLEADRFAAPVERDDLAVEQHGLAQAAAHIAAAP